MIFLGDSITEGWLLPGDRAFPHIIAGKLRDAGSPLRVVNAGRSGDTSADGLRRLPLYLGDDDVEHLVLQLGFNDELQGTLLSETEANLRSIIHSMREHDPATRMHIFQLHSLGIRGAKYTAAFAEMYARIAEDEALALLPFLMEDVAGRAEYNQMDGLHPNAEGMALVADNVWRGLRSILLDESAEDAP